MPTIYDHELASYERAVQELAAQREQLVRGPDRGNLTHGALAYSNRANFALVGLCSLVEARLYDLAQDQENSFKLSDLRGTGLTRLQTFLGRLGVLDFGGLASWSQFKALSNVRNAIVHSYGGLALDEASQELQESLRRLQLEHVLVGGRRLRIGPADLSRALSIVRSLLSEVEIQLKQQ